MSIYSNIEAPLKSRRELLVSLYAYYGDPDPDEGIGLADAVRLITRGEVNWWQVEQAIDAGWDPATQHILDFLGGGAHD